jgi:hypothetical protein
MRCGLIDAVELIRKACVASRFAEIGLASIGLQPGLELAAGVRRVEMFQLAAVIRQL